MKKQKRILICVLNWGLGHATRCMPIINSLLSQGVEVYLASEGRTAMLLQKEYPNLPLLELPAYNITYNTGSMTWNIAPQMPRIIYTIIKEFFVLQRLIKTYEIDAVIADNRYGCFSFSVPCVFISHQLNLKIPFKPLSFFVNLGNRFWVNRFTRCWVPDLPNEPNLSGDLSHGSPFKHVRFLGVLSRMKRYEIALKYDAIAVLSGPEPQRTYFEEALLKQAKQTNYTILIVQGKTDCEEHYFVNERIEVRSYMTAKDLNEAILSSKIIIARSGYSTIMDLTKLGSLAILVPTTGQTEQEFLAENFHKNGIYYSESQIGFSLERAMEKVKDFKGMELDLVENDAFLRAEIQDFLDKLF